MKKITKRGIGLFVAIAMLIQVSCNDSFFDTQPDNQLNIESIFSNREQTEQYWGGLFVAIPDVWDQSTNEIWTYMTDEGDMSNLSRTTTDAMNAGSLNSSNTTNLARQYWEKIRQCVIFMENIENNQEIMNAQNGPQVVARFRAEARFLRAFYYWRTFQIHGPTPILPEGVGLPTDNYQVPRTPVDEFINWLIAELDLARQDLPDETYQPGTTTVDPTQSGRISGMIVEALKSRILLYHASPLFNGNGDYANFRNLDGTLLFNQTYDASRWEKAATAAKTAIDLAESHGKSLYKVQDNDPFRAGFLSSRNLFWDGWRTEGIWVRPNSDIQMWELRAAPRAIAGTSFNYSAVSQQFVDGFRMASGLSIQQDANYNESGFTTEGNAYYVAGTSRMYEGREPRFYAYVTFNGSVIPGAPKPGMTRVEFYNTGNSGAAGAPRDWPRTGYTIRKNIHPTHSRVPSVIVARPAMLIRLAELYLNYAEALNEADPGHPDILQYLNAVRDRGGLPSLSSGLSQAQMREEIRRERQIELCFEGHRFFDVRRWKVPNTPGYQQGGNIMGMDMTRGTTLSDPGFHTRVVAVRRAPWNNRYYFLPFQAAEMDRNTELVQLPGY